MNNGMRSMVFGGLTLLSVFELFPPGLMMGMIVGAGAGLLLARHSEDHTRRRLRVLAGGIGNRASRIAEEATDAVTEVIEQGKRQVS